MREIKALMLFLCLMGVENSFAAEETKFEIEKFPRRKSLRIHAPGLMPPLTLSLRCHRSDNIVPRSGRSSLLALIPYRPGDPRNINPSKKRSYLGGNPMKNWIISSDRKKKKDPTAEKRRQLLAKRRAKAMARIQSMSCQTSKTN